MSDILTDEYLQRLVEAQKQGEEVQLLVSAALDRAKLQAPPGSIDFRVVGWKCNDNGSVIVDIEYKRQMTRLEKAVKWYWKLCNLE